MASAPRVRCFVGAPVAQDLNWEENKLHDEFLPAFRILESILDGSSSNSKALDQSQKKSEDTTTNWRIVPLQPNIRLDAGNTQQASFFKTQTSFYEPAVNREGLSLPFIPPPSSSSTTSADTTTFSEPDSSPEYFRHSFKLHERIKPAHISQYAPTQATTSFRSTTSFTSVLSTTPPPLVLPPNLLPTPLASLPSAAHLLALHPQTPTTTLLVAVLSCTPRTILIKRKPSKHTRKGPPQQHPEHTERHLLDLLVADPSRAGFKCSFWLPENTGPSESGLEALDSPLDVPLRKLAGLRKGCIVLVHRVALTAFAGAVYGQSLNPYVTKQRTSVDLLVDAEGEVRVEIEDEGWRGRVEEVKEWVERFVGRTAGRGKPRNVDVERREGKKAKRIQDEDLPPDESMMG